MDKIKNQNLMAKIICVLLSFGLWLYITNVENPARSYDIKNIPVELVNIDAVKTIAIASGINLFILTLLKTFVFNNIKPPKIITNINIKYNIVNSILKILFPPF